MKFFGSNISALKQTDPELADFLVRLPSGSRVRKQGENGNFSVDVTQPDGSTVRFADLKNPDSVKKLPLRDPMKNSPLIVVYGFGTGSHVLDLFRSTSEKTYLHVIEPDADLFREVLEGVDYSEILGSERIGFAIGESPFDASYVRMEKKYGVFTIRDFQIIRHPLSVSIQEEYYKELDTNFAHLVDMARQNLDTLNNLSKIWQNNVFTNLPYIFDRFSIQSLFGKFKGVPVILVSAGPSLDKNVKWVEAAKGKAVIVCVDTALRTLLENGIEPDFVVAVDAQIENYYHMAGIRTNESCLVANPVTFPNIVSEFNGPIFFTTYMDPLVQWVEEFTGDLGQNITGGSVATAAFDFANRLGASPIVLVGQDLAYSHGRTHSNGTHYGEVSFRRLSCAMGMEEQTDYLIGDNEITYAEDGFGGDIKTSKKMNSWRNWFEIKIDKENIDCINSTEGGVRIQGAKTMSLQEVIRRFCTGKVNLPDVLEKVSQNQGVKNLEGFLQDMEKMIQVSRNIKNLCGEGRKTVQQLQGEFDQSNPDDPWVTHKLNNLARYAEQITNEPQFVELNKWSMEFVIDRVTQIHEKSKDMGHRYQLAAGIHGYDVFFETVYEISKTFEKVLSRTIREPKFKETASV